MIIMGGAAYFRSLGLLRNEATDQMTFAVQGQSSALQDWSSKREQFLFVVSQRPDIKDEFQELLASPEDQDLIRTVEEELTIALEQKGEVLFSDLLLVSASDGFILASSDPEQRGEAMTSLLDSDLATVQTLAVQVTR
jgi:hypothetical protein